MISMTRVPIPPPPTSTGRMEMYKTTFYPSATTADAATAITVTSGDERAGVNVTLRPLPVVRLSGRMVMPDGTPPGPRGLRLIGDSAKNVGDAGFEAASGMTDANGRFLLLGVPAGDYVLKTAKTNFQLESRDGVATFWVQQRIAVGNKDLDDLTVTLHPTLRLEGRDEFRGPDGLVPQPLPLGYRTILFEAAFGDQQNFGIESVTDTFATRALPGQYVLKARDAYGWYVQSVTLDGKDITDRSFDLQADVTSLVVTYSQKHSSVSGTVRDAQGRASDIAAVLVFPADPARWSGYGSSPRIVGSKQVSRTGAYSFDSLPVGDYFLVAVDSVDTDNWTDPQNLERLARQATRLKLALGESKTIDLTLKVVR